jgi:hypothetical protein
MKGYGAMSVNGRMRTAHRVAWKLYRGDIPKDMFVLHRCDNRICVNPDHLFLGTPQTNADDMVAKGRSPHSRFIGERNGRVKLTEKQVIEIKNRRQQGENWKILAKEYDVSHQTIWKISTGLRWRHI